MDSNLTEANNRFTGVVDHLKSELSAIRAGRATPSLIENVSVEAYGSKMKLLEVGTISAPQPSLLTVQVWDVSIVPGVVKSIQEANLGLNPSYEGQIIRLPIPPLTAERREEFIKLAHQKMEESRVSVRQIRQDIRQGWEQTQKAGEFGEDEFDRRSRLLQELIDKYQEMIDNLGKQKEEELNTL